MANEKLSEVVAEPVVAAETGENEAMQKGPAKGGLLTTTPGFPEGNGTFSTKYPVRAEVEVVEDRAELSGNLQISVEAEIRRTDEFVEKVLPDENERLAALVARTSLPEKTLGRPKALDEFAQIKLCQMLKLGYTRSLAAAQMGLHRSTITKAMRSDAAFRRQVLQAEALHATVPMLTILEAAQTDWRAAVWLQKNHDPHASVRRRRRRQNVRDEMQAEQFVEQEQEQAARKKKVETERQDREREQRYRRQEKERAAKQREIKAEVARGLEQPDLKVAEECLLRVKALEKELKELRVKHREENERLG